MENELENLDSSNENNENLDSSTEEAAEESAEALKEKVAELERVNKDLHGRATRAEQGLKKLAPAPKKEESELPKKDEPLSLKDIRALQDVHDEDVDEVVEFAKFKGITIAEAKKLPAIQSLLSTKEEFRKSAQATNTGRGGKATSKDTPEAILQRAESGQLPEDDDGIKKLAEARLQAKLDKLEKK